MASDWEGVSVAPGDTMFTVSPTWERLDNRSDLRVSRIEVERGRQDEFERTDTGTATVIFKDRYGTLDPSNIGGPFGDLVSRPIGIALRDPVTNAWFPIFRGVIDDYGYNLSPSQQVGEIAITCVDALEYFAGFELAPGIAGDTPPSGEEGNIFYEDTAGTVDDRIFQALADASWPTGLSSVFSGNVSVRESTYSPGESMLVVLQEAADAEFPTVANFYIDRFGFFCFHGRYARFDPDAVSATATHWDFHRWKAGDGAAIVLDDERAQLRPPFGFNRGRSLIRNAALCYPMGIRPTDIPGQIVTDSPSIAVHGVHSWSATDLVILEGTTTGNTGNQECELYAQYIVENYRDPQNRIEQASFKSLRPTDDRAAATWALLTGVDLSDILDLEITHPGGGGFNSEHFIEAINYEIEPLVNDLDTGYPAINLTLDLSPAVYWANSPFPAYS